MDFLGVNAQLLGGFKYTLLIFFITLVAAIPLGLPIALGSMSRFKPLRWISRAFVWVIRGTPLMLQIMVVFYVPGLVFGTPGSGKTTFLRSIIRYLDTARRIFCVADERGELLTAGHTVHCDVYTRCTKAQAIQMALRCMNPQVIVCDELGTQADLQAVEAGLACGVVFVASVHCDTLEALNRKPPTARLLAMGAFETLVLLDGRVNPGHAVKVRTLA